MIKAGKFPLHLRCQVVHLFLQDDKTAKVAAVASDGQFWISRVLSTIGNLEKDTKYVALLSEVDEEEHALRQKACQLIERLKKVRTSLISGCLILTPRPRQVADDQQDAAKGAELLLSATLLHQHCVDDGEEDDSEALEVRDFFRTTSFYLFFLGA